MPRTKSLRPSTPPDRLQHAISRLDLVLLRLCQATSSDPLEAVPLSAADAVVLRDLVTDALEDCEELRRAAAIDHVRTSGLRLAEAPAPRSARILGEVGR